MISVALSASSRPLTRGFFLGFREIDLRPPLTMTADAAGVVIPELGVAASTSFAGSSSDATSSCDCRHQCANFAILDMFYIPYTSFAASSSSCQMHSVHLSFLQALALLSLRYAALRFRWLSLSFSDRGPGHAQHDGVLHVRLPIFINEQTVQANSAGHVRRNHLHSIPITLRRISIRRRPGRFDASPRTKVC